MKAHTLRCIASVIGALVSLSIPNFVGSPSYAQSTAPSATPSPTPTRNTTIRQIRRFERLDALLDQLSLTDGQKTRISSIELAAHQQIMAARFNRSLTPLQRQDQVRNVVKSTVDQIRALLGPVQRRRFRVLAIQAIQARQNQMEAKPAANGTAPAATPGPPSAVTADGDHVEF